MANKLLLRFFVLLVGLSLCSCSTGLTKFGHVEKFAYNKIIIDKVNNASFQKGFVNFSRNSKENCFRDEINENSYGDVITVKATDLDKAINYFYKNKATWDIKEIKKNDDKETYMVAETEMNFKYEVSYCSFAVLGFQHEYEYAYASFRLLKN